MIKVIKLLLLMPILLLYVFLKIGKRLPLPEWDYCNDENIDFIIDFLICFIVMPLLLLLAITTAYFSWMLTDSLNTFNYVAFLFLILVIYLIIRGIKSYSKRIKEMVRYVKHYI